ncbi:MAG TPA: FAD-dependent oxidoreductase, partial [Longimicrobiales bacterium]|nr:FAD-dependent oxidoreductase [Longimicrobiales bacterium]
MNQTFDVILVGAGIMGCATALELSRRGLSVAVVEKGALASGSTGKSSAIVRQHYSNEVTARMARWGLDVFRDFDERVGGPCGFVNAGFLVLVPAGDAEGLRANVALQQAVDVNTRILSPEEIRDVLPG